MKVDELVRNLRHVEQGYAEKHYSVGEVRVCDMAKDCADALESLFASNQQTKAALAPFQAAAAEYGIDAQTMLTLARSQIATAEENAELREAITGAWLQLHTATFSANKGAADLAKFILTYLPDPPQKG